MSKGHSTTDALLYMLQAVYEAVDCGKASARLFFADFTKGFDLIDHAILMRQLAKLEVHPVLLKWIATFLTNRRQVVRNGRTLKGGVPQGTKLGVIFFTVMTNKLLSDWHFNSVLNLSLIHCLGDYSKELYKFSQCFLNIVAGFGYP